MSNVLFLLFKDGEHHPGELLPMPSLGGGGFGGGGGMSMNPPDDDDDDDHHGGQRGDDGSKEKGWVDKK